jgi:hypothetical protein
MTAPTFTKINMNGYDVISANSGDWRVCTKSDRLGAFGSREEALAFAASLPGYKERPEQSVHTEKPLSLH